MNPTEFFAKHVGFQLLHKAINHGNMKAVKYAIDTIGVDPAVEHLGVKVISKACKPSRFHIYEFLADKTKK